MKRQNAQHCEGFTLFELLTVMALIAILAAFVVPSVQFSQPNRLSEAVATVNTALDEARTRSVMRRSRHQLVFTAQNVSLVPDGGSERFPESVRLVSIEIEGESDRVEDEFPAFLPFHRRGNTVHASLVFENVETGESRTVVISPLGFSAVDQED